MASLQNRVAVVTGAGGGIGRQHALALAAEGAAVVVNDIGPGALDVAGEITNSGGNAVAVACDVADWGAAEELITTATQTFGDLHILVNNAGIVRDRTLANMSEDEWDSVIRVDLKGHAAPTCHAMAYWRRKHKTGAEDDRSLIHTTSLAGVAGNIGQANYAAAKGAVLALSRVAALEGHPYGVRSNVISPSARTSAALAVADPQGTAAAPTDGTADPLDPAEISPLVLWLASPHCAATSQLFHISAERILILRAHSVAREFLSDQGWQHLDLQNLLGTSLVDPVSVQALLMGTRTGSIIDSS